MNDLIRSFVAIELPVEVKNELADIIQSLQNEIKSSFRWVSVSNIHLTLKFLGNIPKPSLSQFGKALAENSSINLEFALSLNQLGVFPSISKPRVLWVGIQAPQDLFILQKNIEKLSETFGITPEDRPFSPHLTIARCTDQINHDTIEILRSCISRYSPIKTKSFVKVDQITLFQSVLKPGGPVYTPLMQARLKSIR